MFENLTSPDAEVNVIIKLRGPSRTKAELAEYHGIVGWKMNRKTASYVCSLCGRFGCHWFFSKRVDQGTRWNAFWKNMQDAFFARITLDSGSCHCAYSCRDKGSMTETIRFYLLYIVPGKIISIYHIWSKGLDDLLVNYIFIKANTHLHTFETYTGSLVW